jgi:hypothetical protein
MDATRYSALIRNQRHGPFQRQYKFSAAVHFSAKPMNNEVLLLYYLNFFSNFFSMRQLALIWHYYAP